MDRLQLLRQNAGPRLTVGLNDSYIAQFLAQDLNLALAIQLAYDSVFSDRAGPNYLNGVNHGRGGAGVGGDLKSLQRRPEGELISEIQAGWCHLYPEDTRNPYVALAAKGPWIVTLHGAVLHDNGGYGMLGLGHSPDVVMQAMGRDVVMANIMTPSLGQRGFIEAIRREIGRKRASGIRC